MSFVTLSQYMTVKPWFIDDAGEWHESHLEADLKVFDVTCMMPVPESFETGVELWEVIGLTPDEVPLIVSRSDRDQWRLYVGLVVPHAPDDYQIVEFSDGPNAS